VHLSSARVPFLCSFFHVFCSLPVSLCWTSCLERLCGVWHRAKHSSELDTCIVKEVNARFRIQIPRR
jgi:hypothetical protein